MQKSFANGYSDACNGNDGLDASGFTCLDEIVNSQMLCRSISDFDSIPCWNSLGFDCIEVTVGIYL